MKNSKENVKVDFHVKNKLLILILLCVKNAIENYV